VFINLETDPHIPHSSPRRACVNLPPPIAFGLPLMSALGCYSDSRSRPCSDTPRTPTHVRTRTLLGLPFTSVLGRYSDPCSLPHSDATRTPAHFRARMLLGLLLTSALGLYSEPHSSSVIHPPPCNPVYTDLTRSSVSICATSSRNSTRTFRSGVRSGIHVSSYKSEPVPSDPFGPPSLSALQSEPLPSNSARASAQTSVSRSVL
jgi:hypothetical protein